MLTTAAAAAAGSCSESLTLRKSSPGRYSRRSVGPLLIMRLNSLQKEHVHNRTCEGCEVVTILLVVLLCTAAAAEAHCVQPNDCGSVSWSKGLRLLQPNIKRQSYDLCTSLQLGGAHRHAVLAHQHGPALAASPERVLFRQVHEQHTCRKGHALAVAHLRHTTQTSL
jgi:hypothetical protein